MLRIVACIAIINTSVIDIAHAWEPACRVITDEDFIDLLVKGDFARMRAFPECRGDAALATGHWVGQHFESCIRALTLEDLSPNIGNTSEHWEAAALLTATMPLAIEKSGYTWKRSAFDKAVLGFDDLIPAPPIAFRHFCEFSEIPDNTQSLADWASGHRPQDCPGGSGECRDFASLGPLNSNHFGAQAAATYLSFHNKAMSIARLAQDVSKRTSEAYKKYPVCIVGQGGCLIESQYIGEFRSSNGLIDVALAYEGMALHYLEDLWSAGHMWNRWGSPVLSTFTSRSEAGAVAIMAGLIHGARALTGLDDGMCSPMSKAARWGFPNLPQRFEAAGDLHLTDVLTDARYAEQRKHLLSCTALSIGEILLGADRPSEFESLRAKYPLDKCLNHFVTNSTVTNAFSVTVPGKWIGAGPVNVELGAVAVTELAGIPGSPAWTALVGKIGGFDLALIKKYYGQIWADSVAVSSVSPDGFDLATTRLSAVGKIKNGSAYTSEATSFTTLPDLNVQFDTDNVLLRGSKSRAIMMAVAPRACSLVNTQSVENAVKECKSGTKPAACSICRQWIAEHFVVPGERPSICQMEIDSHFARLGFNANIDRCFDDDAVCPKQPKKCKRIRPSPHTSLYWDERFCSNSQDSRSTFPAGTSDADMEKACSVH